VFSFENCDNLALSRLTLGHTLNGDCSGSVLGFRHCAGVELSQMDLYGCGTYGIEAREGSGDIQVYDSTIRDCSYGPFCLYDCDGEIAFQDCLLTGSGGGTYDAAPRSQLRFTRCTFGEWESNSWYFREDAIKEDCTWSEITEYPDYSDVAEYIPPFDPERMQVAPFDQQVLNSTYWLGYLAVDPASGVSRQLPYQNMDSNRIESASIYFYDDGTGWLDYWNGVIDFTWYCDSTYSAYLTAADQSGMTVSLYTAGDEYGSIWLFLRVNEESIWFY